MLTLLNENDSLEVLCMRCNKVCAEDEIIVKSGIVSIKICPNCNQPSAFGTMVGNRLIKEARADVNDRVDAQFAGLFEMGHMTPTQQLDVYDQTARVLEAQGIKQ